MGWVYYARERELPQKTDLVLYAKTSINNNSHDTIANADNEMKK